MPWEHCDRELNDDVDCPCGMSKARWTVEVDRTRRFVITKKPKEAWVEVVLRDRLGDPAKGQAFELERTDDRTQQGALPADGRVRVDRLYPGVCQVAYPGAGPTRAVAPPAAPSLWACCGEEAGDGAPRCPRCDQPERARPGPLDRVRAVAARWLEVEVQEPGGAPRRFERVHLRTPAETRPCRTDRDGLLRGDGLDDGEHAAALERPGHWLPFAHPERRALELELLDLDGAGVAGERYEVLLADGCVVAGRLDGQGRAAPRVDADAHALVRFPDRAVDAWAPERAAVVGHVELELLDVAGLPMAQQPYEVRTPDGRLQRGLLDADGRARVPVTHPHPMITFPRLPSGGWAPSWVATRRA